VDALVRPAAAKSRNAGRWAVSATKPRNAGSFTHAVAPWRHKKRRPGVPEIADRLWRPPLALAVFIFAACGPVHAMGHTDVVFFAVLIGLALSALAVPLGLLGLKR
jgi:hypothetical protein